ncbi:hypothetical protein ACOXXX_18100 [Thalassococcus sp. BH17M4-6]|uniref:hypothetical protein n=1 Tax=Thalassococcus sp. BH17M4-6 TaxID=3413148 RepID=UPI003BD1C7F8
MLDRLNAQVTAREANIDTVVLSSEAWFFRPYFAENPAFSAFCAQFESCKVMCYVRRPSAYYLSALQQQLKADHRVITPSTPSYRFVMETLGRHYGLQVRDFDRTALYSGDIVQDFARQVLGIDLPSDIRGPGSNKSFSSAGMHVLQQWRASLPQDSWGKRSRETIAFEAALREAEEKLGPAPSPKLHNALAAWLDRPTENLTYLRDTFGIDFITDAGDVAAPQITADTPLKEITPIDWLRVDALQTELGLATGTVRLPESTAPTVMLEEALENQQEREPEELEMSTKNTVAPKRTAVMVLGMHRSGTSALGGVLSILGCDRPAQEMKPNASNEQGYFESQVLYGLHNRLLKSAGSSWDDWTEFNPRWFDSPRGAEFRAAAAEALQAEFGTSPLFLLKDPRICRFVPFWAGVLDDAGCAVKVVHTHRNPLEVAASLEKRDGLPRDLGVLIWLRYVLDAEYGSRGMSRTFTSYRHLLSDWASMASQIEEDLDLLLPRMSPGSAREIDAFLRADLRHFDEPQTRVLRNPFISDWVRSAFSILERWAETGEDAADHAAFDQMRAAFNAAAPAFAQLVEIVRDDAPNRAKLQESESKRKEEKAKYDELKESHQTEAHRARHAQRQRDAAQADLDAAKNEIKGLSDRLAQTENSLGERIAGLEKERDAATDRVKGLTGDLDAAQSDLDAARNEIKCLSDRLAQTESSLGERIAGLEKERDAAADRVKGLTGDLDDARAELDTANNEIKDLSDRLAQTQSALEQRRAEAEEVGAALEMARAETSRQDEKLRTRAEEMSRLTGAVIDLETELRSIRSAQQTAERALRETREKFDRENAAHRATASELKAARSRVTELDGDLARLTRLGNADKQVMTERLRGLESRLGEKEAELHQAQLEHTQLAKKARDQADKILRTETKLSIRENELKESLARVENQNETLANQAQRLEAAEYALMALQDSSSWKFTAPLRRLGSLLRRS